MKSGIKIELTFSNFVVLKAKDDVVRNDVHIDVEIPKSLVEVVKRLKEKLSTEFNIMLWGSITPWPITTSTKEVKVKITDYKIPKQRASTAYVEVLDLEETIGAIGTIHRHPDGVTSFSTTDIEHTNTKFPFNLLYVPVEKFSLSWTPRWSWSSWSWTSWSEWWKKNEELTTVKIEEEKDDELQDILDGFRVAHVWCVDSYDVILSILKEISIDFNEKKIAVELVNPKTLLLTAKICETSSLSFNLYEDERNVDKIVEEALKKIDTFTYSFRFQKEEKEEKEKKINSTSNIEVGELYGSENQDRPRGNLSRDVYEESERKEEERGSGHSFP